MKKTIEDLKESRTYYRRNKDAFGNVTREPYEALGKRKVKVVTGWARFGHYILDMLIIWAILVAVEIAFLSAGIRNPVNINLGVGPVQYNISLFNYLVVVSYYLICEMTMQRTVGKFATNSVVINQYAESPDTNTLIGRSFSRIVPFEAFSCLSDRGWHDSWSKTYVVTTKERDELKRLLSAEDGVFISDSDEILD